MNKYADRQYIIIYLFVISGIILIGKAAQLQIFSSQYRDMAERTTLSRNVIYPARGMMFDRNGKILVANNPIYDIEVIYRNVNPKMDTALFCQLLNISKQTFIDNINKDWSNIKYSKSTPFTFLNKIDPDIFSRYQEQMYQFPGFYPVVRNVRSYPHKSGAHALGYLMEVQPKDVEVEGSEYVPGDLIGAIGLEKQYEKELKGKKGIEYLLRDNLGRNVGSYNHGRLDSAAVSGEDLIISLDLDLQEYGEWLMVNKRGAIVAIEPSTGEILTMISAPVYDPNLLSFTNNRNKTFKELVSDELNKPLINRAVTAKYPPGSIFKPVLSAVALQHGTWPVNRSFSCRMGYPLGSRLLGCHRHPPITSIPMAIQHSCNAYYFQMFREFIDQYGFTKAGMGMDTLMTYLDRFGLGRKLEIDYTFESPGSIPWADYYNRVYRSEVTGWKSTYTISLGIGQGEFEFTTVQMANLAAAIANKGYYITPHFLKGYRSGIKPVPEKYRTKHNTGIEEKHFLPVIDGMEKAVLGGTSRIAQVAGIEVCGKTGTSQNPHGEDHSVFFAFAPKDNPKIAIAVFVENAGWGASYAAPIAGLMIEKYLKGEVSPSKKWLEDRMVNANLLEKPVL
ncbi:MAG TPA: penicillin-binding transpeptidase domain-containing protein [Saprospiraceae bacterium]|nr:penicillin-binding transpeptidase domain-containing protein [Saprospiraceae bacterium]